MKAEDIIWGGNNKGVIRLKNDIGLEPGTLVNIEYDYIKEVYYLNRDVERVDISAAENVIEMLNNIYLTGTAPTTMVWVVDKEENLNYIIEIKVFREEITFGKLNAIEIKIGDEVIDKMRIRDKENPIAYLDNAFKYGDRVFVRGYGRKGASFTILSADKTLNVRQVGNEYIATKLVRYDKSRADMEAVFILKGDLSFVDSSRSAFVSGEVAHQTLRDQIYAWKSKGMDAAEGLELLRTVAEANRLKLSNKLNESINEILGRAMVRSTGQSMELQAVEDEEREEIKKVLLAQRTTPESYADDGKKQAYALKQLILQEIIDNGGDTAAIDEVLRTKGQDPKVLKTYEQFVDGLKKKYVTVKKVDTAISSVDSVEQCLKEVDSELERVRLERLENRNEATAYILQNFLECIQDEKEIERIIEKYANVTAATCQQSMGVGRFAMNTTYDLVIVDEAARANPLDLLIPVSMGKQVILVGDHKQLPHMLDPDVVKQFETDEKMQELGVLQESLFERLFNMFSRSEGRVKRTARLSKQYRMHPVIGEFASDNFYSEYKLDSSEVKVEDKTAHLNGLYNDRPIAWINLDKNNYGMEIGRRSKKREKEAARIIKEVKKVLAIAPKKSIGIISFYKSQSDYLKDIAKTELTDAQNDRVEIGTVDAFQGKEFDVVFLSCVRANVIDLEDRRHRIGHIDDLSRLCVSFTRARQLMVAVGDRETVECIPALADFIGRCREGGSYYE